MGRLLKRVPLDFDAPLDDVWKGYINPYYKRCPDCEGGYTPDHKWLSSIVHLLLMAGAAGIDDGPLHPWLWNMTLAPNTKPSIEMAKLTGGLAGRMPRVPFGHDGSDNWSAERKIIIAAGLDPETWGICQTCKGEAVDPSISEQYNAWEAEEPPVGDGYQLWENTTEGSPQSPVFSTMDELCEWSAENASTFGGYTASAEEWKKMLSEGMVYHQEGNIIMM